MNNRIGLWRSALMVLLLVGLSWTASAAAAAVSAINQNTGVGASVSASSELFLRSLQGGSIPQGVTSIGYYVLDSNYDPISGLGGTLDLAKVASGSAVSLGTFTAGQQVAFWMKTEDGTMLESIYDEEKGNDRKAAYVENNGSGNLQMVLGFGGYGGGYSPVKPGQLDTASDFYFEVSGQPRPGPAQGSLPGMLVSLIFGAVVLAVIWLRPWARKRAAA